MKRVGTATWNGNLRNGKGTMGTESNVLDGAPYGFSSRFESQKGTNPEELIAAAHAGCFSMALSAGLEAANMTPKTIQTTATISLNKVADEWKITEINLKLHAHVPGANKEAFMAIATKAKTNCPVSQLLNAPIHLDAELDVST